MYLSYNLFALLSSYCFKSKYPHIFVNVVLLNDINPFLNIAYLHDLNLRELGMLDII